MTRYNAATMGFGRASLIEAIGTFMLVFVIFGVIDHRAVPGWAPMAIGSVVFAIIIILGPATGAAINPARYLGAVFMQSGFGGTVSWAQVPAYLIGELAGGVLGGLAYVFIGRVRSDAAMTSLAPDADPVPEPNSVEQRHEEAHQQPGDGRHRRPRGVAAAHPSLAVDVENKVITRAGGPTTGKVGLVSGGGSGHEPLHGGFVGYGMLDAACPGEVFTSPVPDQMLAATKAVNGGAGVLHVVKNYTGDVLNFQMAAELAGDEGIEVVSVVTNDDVAVEDSLYTAGRRGTGATVFVEKIAGALAEEGADLAAVAAAAREVNDRSRSFGVALSSCVVPAAGKPTFELGDSEIELGIGIHGEPGRTRAAHMPARELAAVALDAIGADLPVGGTCW